MSGERARSRSVASNMEVDSLLTDYERIHAQSNAQDVDSDAFIPAPRGRFLYVAVPPRSHARREIESSVVASDYEDTDVEERGQPVEVVGEYRINHVRHFFALFEDNIIRRFPAADFTKHHHDLVEAYRDEKAKGTLDPFDPDAPNVHERSRVKITRAMETARSSISGSTIPAETDTDFDAGVTQSDESEDYETESNGREGRRRVAPNRRQIYMEDWFGTNEPRKTRPTRASARQRDPVLVEHASQDDSEDELPKFTGIRIKRPPRTVQPAYGIVREVEQMYDSDDETAPLRAHRDTCEKCGRAAAHVLLSGWTRKSKKGRKKWSRNDIDADLLESSDGEATFERLGGWVRCLRCPLAYHWNCLSPQSRTDITRAVRDRQAPDAPKWQGLSPYDTTEVLCPHCAKGGICMVCHQPASAPALQKKPNAPKPEVPTIDGQQNDKVSGNEVQGLMKTEDKRQLFFRCGTCKRAAHYEHLENPLIDEPTLVEIARAYQEDKSWLCDDCSSFPSTVEKIIAWRPYPPNAEEAKPDEPHYRDTLPREYLVKWPGKSYRRTSWVPHLWLLARAQGKLRNFLDGKGPKMQLEHTRIIRSKEGEEGVRHRVYVEDDGDPKPPTALPNAEGCIPEAWLRVDRVLDVRLWTTEKKELTPAKKNGRSGKKWKGGRKVISSDEELEEVEIIENGLAANNQRENAYRLGQEPYEGYLETVDEWMARTSQNFTTESIDQVIWCYFKWEGLDYAEASWDSPPRRDDPAWDCFEKAFGFFVAGRNVRVPTLSRTQLRESDDRLAEDFHRKNFQINRGLIENLKLRDFQIEGVNWLYYKWWSRQPGTILADEMGLGKTVQIVTLLGRITLKHGRFPALVVVPNSTIMNWIREFEAWAPQIRAVPYFGEAASREIMKQYEVFHGKARPSFTKLKFHVLLTTYETFNNRRGDKGWSSVFNGPSRWEILVVDEGQRLKNDDSKLFHELNTLRVGHRILMTGTPLNNNIEELFNLMYFIDPVMWPDPEERAKEHEDLNEDAIKKLHEALRPYFIRRTKEILNLPPKNEVIVPISMTSMQRRVYKSVLEHDFELLNRVLENNGTTSKIGKNNLRNLLMQLRKTVQHPYLIDQDLEPPDLSAADSHKCLVEASGKLSFLKVMLNKLKLRGHRVLLFSQFVINLDIIEDFLVAEGHKFLRLDGNQKTSLRQRDIDRYNDPNSDVFIMILSTRAGGVGINLATADTVIIYDPDFNPHQDIQAIARAHRFGQKKTCLIFRFMGKQTAEERIMQIGKKKLALDHLIVQSMENEAETSDDVQSILLYGAKALFETGSEQNDIHYSDQDIENLIERTEQAAATTESLTSESGLKFDFAKIWEPTRGSLEEITEDPSQIQGDDDFWAKILEQSKQKEGEAKEKMGRGVRRKAAAAVASYTKLLLDMDHSPKKPTKGSQVSVASDVEYQRSNASESESGSSMDAAPDSPLFPGAVLPSASMTVFRVPAPLQPPLHPSNAQQIGISTAPVLPVLPVLPVAPSQAEILEAQRKELERMRRRNEQAKARRLRKQQEKAAQERAAVERTAQERAQTATQAAFTAYPNGQALPSAVVPIQYSTPASGGSTTRHAPNLSASQISRNNPQGRAQQPPPCPLCSGPHEPGKCPALHDLPTLYFLREQMQNEPGIETLEERRDALQEIDNLIAQAKARQRTLAPKPHVPTSAELFSLFSDASAPPRNPPTGLWPQGALKPPMPGPSSSIKRPAQGISPDERASKRPKHHTVSASQASQNANGLPAIMPPQPAMCPVCGIKPVHPLLNCGVVKLGPVAMKRSIEQLEGENNPAHWQALDQLRTLYSNVTNIAKRISTPVPKPQNDMIDLTSLE